MPNKTALLAGMLILCIILGAAVIPSTIKIFTTVSAASPLTVSVIFPNGKSTINENYNTDFIVNITIANAPANSIGFYSIALQWNTSALSLQHNATSDIAEGPWLKTYGSTIYPGATIDTANGTAVVSDGVLTFNSGVSGAGGSGTMFTVALVSKKKSPSISSSITILAPNEAYTTYPYGSYLLNGTDTEPVNITQAVNGAVTVVPEFPASALLPLFLATTTIAIAAATVTSRKRRIPSTVSQHQ